MDCQGIISFLLRRGIGVQAKELSEALDLSQYEVVYVDLFAKVFWTIVKTYKNLREGSPEFDEASAKFEEYLLEYFRGFGPSLKTTVIVLDGAVTKAKEDTKMKRMAIEGKKSIQKVWLFK